MNSQALQYPSEAVKNRKAFLYTSLVCGLFLIIAIFYTWPLQVKASPVVQDLIDVNLGNEMEGWGEVQPLVPGDPAPDDPSVNSNATALKSNDAPPSQNIQADESGDENAVAIVKTTTPPKNSPLVNKESTDKNVKKNNPSPVTVTNPTPPKPKLPMYKGGTGTGGNGATEDNGYRNQGYNPGGSGDKGSPDGKPDAYGDSPGGKSGVSVYQGLSGRHPISFPNMTDEFNENAKIYVSIKVDGLGKVISATVSKSTTTNNSLKNIAIQKAKLLKFPTSKNEVEIGTILFNFVIKN
ncbi:MAG: hypothetical protein ABI208_03305 [Ginsengibacter sp.]